MQSWLKSSLFQQTFPFVVLIIVPSFVFFAATRLRRLARFLLAAIESLSMGLDSLGFTLPWNWTSASHQASSSALSSSSLRREKKKSGGKHATSGKSKGARTRAEQIAMNDITKHKVVDSDAEEAQYYPGLVNISGTYCFMNSTLQALASLTYLQPHISAIHAKAEALDVPTPVIDALQDLFTSLNTPKSRYNSLRPVTIINALSSPPPPLYPTGPNPIHRTSTSLFNSREHQDAQELFQLVSECIKNEMVSVDREGLRDRGIAGVLDLGLPSSLGSTSSEKEGSSKSVFDGLTANRRSCVVCGYTEAVMHFGFDNWQLAVPRLATSCRLEDCLEDYTTLEILKDCICRKCSVLATHRRLLQEVKTLEEALNPTPTPALLSSSSSPHASSSTSTSFSALASSTSMPSTASPAKPKPSASKKKRLKEVKKMEQRVRTALAEGRIEDEDLLKDIKLERIVSPASTKQAMIARPPPILALHLNRSVHYGQFAAKNTIKVTFPEVLDLTPYTTSGSLSTVPTSSISTPSAPPSPSPYSSITFTIDDLVPSREIDQKPPKRSTTPTPATYAPGTQRTLYRLAAVVCHYGQHSFGHYICYRRKPRRIAGLGGRWNPPTLLDPLLKMEEDEDEDRNLNEVGNGNAEAGTNAVTVKLEEGSRKQSQESSSISSSSSSSFLSEPRYLWEDCAEADVGTGRGWLRISDDSVQECGIESVLAEGSGVFMLYYEKVVHPRLGVYIRGNGKGRGKMVHLNTREGDVDEEREGVPIKRSGKGRSHGSDLGTDTDGADTDADGFSIGSEETLKPEMKVVDLNGSVGSLISEVGVGVLKVQKKDKEKIQEVRESGKGKEREKDGDWMSMSMSASFGSSRLSSPPSSSGTPFGARIIRSVNARQRSHPPPSQLNGSASVLMDGKLEGINGVHGDRDESIPPEMVASAPSILSSNANPNSELTTGGGDSNSSHANVPLPQQTPSIPIQSRGLGSKSTRVAHHPPAGAKVRLR